MKKTTLSKIFGAALVIALLASLVVAAVPASALTIVSVTPSSTTISASGTTYTVKFTGSLNLATSDTVTITFMTDTDLSAYTFGTGIRAVGDNIYVTDAGTITGDGTFAASLNGTAVPAATWAAGQYVAAGDEIVVTTVGTILTNTASGAVTAANDITFNGVDATPGQNIVIAARSVTFDVPVAATIVSAWTVVINKVINPSSPGSYALTVATSQETTATTSSSYTIGVPIVVSRYNSAGNFVGSYSGTGTELSTAYSSATNGDTIKLGPGTYTEATIANTSGTAKAYVTFTSTSSASDTIIKATSPGVSTFTVAATDTYITFDNITFACKFINNGTYTTVQNCVFNYPGPYAGATTLFANGATGTNLTIDTCAFDTTANGNTTADVAIALGDAVGASASPYVSISDCTFALNENSSLTQDIAIKATNNTWFTASGCTFTGSSGIGYTDSASANASFKNNTYTSVQNAAVISYASTFDFEGNTVSACTAGSTKTVDGAIILKGTAATKATIVNNVIQNGEYYSLNVTATPTYYVISGNQFVSNTNGLYSTVSLNVVLNWWGSSAGPTTSSVTGGDTIVNSTGSLTYTPFLTAAPSAATSAIATGAVATSLASNSYSTVGVVISGYTATAAGDFILAQKLATNPQTLTPPYPYIAYFDVYTSVASTTAVQLNFYATGISTTTQVYYWSGAVGDWVLCDTQGVAGTGSYVYVTINATTAPALADLTGTSFVLVSGLAKAAASFDVNSPALGSSTTLTNIPFSWDAVSGATSYEFILSANADLSSPIVDQSLSGTAFTYTGSLTEGPYYWQANAYVNNAIIAKSVTGTFIATAPTTTTSSTPVVIISTVTAPAVTVTPAQATTITVPPATITEVTPAWIWGVIGIGAVLIIVVIVLIVRTRRSV